MNNENMTPGAILLILSLCVVFGGNGVAIKYGLTGLGSFTSAGIRFAIAGAALALWARHRGIPMGLTPKQARSLSLQCCLFTFQVCCFHLGLARTTASHAALIANVLPFIVLILAHFFIPGDRITWRKGVGVALGFLGVVLLFLDDPDLGADLRTGDIIVLCAVVSWSFSAVHLKRIIGNFNPVQVTLYPMISGLPVFFIAGMMFDTPMVRGVTLTVVMAIGYQALIASSFGFVAWNTMLRQYGATALHSFVFIIPLVGVLAGVTLLGEPVTRNLLASVVLIVAGIMVVNIPIGKKPTISAIH